MKETTYTDIVQNASAEDLLYALQAKLPFLPAEAARSAEYADLGGYDSPYPQVLGLVSSLIGQLKRTHAEVSAMARHRHEWGENDYCSVCGADGRA